MKNTTAVLISMMRDAYTKECVKSLREMYPEIKILVAENAHFNQELKDFVNEHGGRYILMPFDSGVCFARNRLVEMVDTEFILVSDDDFYYTKEAKVKEMIKFLEANKDYTLIGGRIFEKGRVLEYQGHINIHTDHFEYVPLDFENNRKDKASGLMYQQADITFNYFVARKNDIKDVKWDEKIKVAYEHSDWFIGLKKAGGHKVAFTPDAVVTHKPEHIQIPKEVMDQYKNFRNRRSDMHYFFEKHKVKYSLGFRGVRTNFDEIKDLKNKYYATRALTFDGIGYNRGDIIKTDSPTDGMSPCY